ncbi:MAG: sigma-70 family RNA polymerase sigma factor [Thermoleophilaceae bacterium]|nr:sigma-70 family RNA polymerase sigma factor [Thermoleophilaceae bacterium]
MLDVEALYREHADDLYRVLRRRFDMSVPDAVIEDACGATWAIAWAKREQLLDDNLMGWLVTVGRHEALAVLRRRRFELLVDGGVEPADRRSCPEQALARRARR